MGVGSLSLLQQIFPNQGSNPGLPHCRRILYQMGVTYICLYLWLVHADAWQKPSQCCNYPPVKNNLILKKRELTLSREAGTQRMTFTTLCRELWSLIHEGKCLWELAVWPTPAEDGEREEGWSDSLVYFSEVGSVGGLGHECCKDLTPGRTYWVWLGDAVNQVSCTGNVMAPPWWSRG